MKKQKRGCSRLFYALLTISPEGVMLWGEPKQVAPCKSVSAPFEQSVEGVWADNKKQYNVRGGISSVRTFDVLPIEEEVLADLFNDTLIEIADTVAYSEDPDAEPAAVALGYALHDGDEDNPSELVWVFHAEAQKRPDVVANTITGDDTSSEGQQIAFDTFKPEKAWTTTGKKNPSISIRVTKNIDVEKWFTQVVTPDNIATLFPSGS